MLVSVLGQVAETRLAAPVVIALIFVIAANALALLISLRLARRIRAIGDTTEALDAAVAGQAVPDTASAGGVPTSGFEKEEAQADDRINC